MHELVTRDRLLAIIAVIALCWGLTASYSPTMSIAFAAVVIASVWPLKASLERRILRGQAISPASSCSLPFLSFLFGVNLSAGQLVGGTTARSGTIDQAAERLTGHARRVAYR